CDAETANGTAGAGGAGDSPAVRAACQPELRLDPARLANGRGAGHGPVCYRDRARLAEDSPRETDADRGRYGTGRRPRGHADGLGCISSRDPHSLRGVGVAAGTLARSPVA